MGGNQGLGARTESAQDKNSQTGSPSATSVLFNGLERCLVGSTVKCTMHYPSSTARNELNRPSSSVASTTCPINPCHQKVFEGQVLAFDTGTNVLVLKCPTDSSKTSVHDVHIINMSLPHEIKLLENKKEMLPDPPPLNINRLHNRLRDQVDRKKKQVMAIKTENSQGDQK